jgi:hypothetical protein
MSKILRLKGFSGPYINLNVAKTPHRRVGCAHQTSLISSVKGGQSPPYINNTGINHR